jgi:hypothetical protein
VARLRRFAEALWENRRLTRRRGLFRLNSKCNRGSYERRAIVEALFKVVGAFRIALLFYYPKKVSARVTLVRHTRPVGCLWMSVVKPQPTTNHPYD